jgi:5-formyltetrahydrofolate cyclo-ligase
MNTLSVIEQKQLLRAQLRARRDALSERASRSGAICARLAGLPEFVAAQAIHSYLAIGSEVDLRPILAGALKARKSVAVPVVRSKSRDLSHSWITSLDPSAFTRGALGTPVPEPLRPSDPEAWDVILVPLLGFDRCGYRLGYGAGHYDRLLKQTRGITIGVGFAAQEVPALPHAPHDVRLHHILTEDELITPGHITAPNSIPHRRPNNDWW